MNTTKRVLSLLLVFTLMVFCIPSGIITAFATETKDPNCFPGGLPAADAAKESTTQESAALYASGPEARGGSSGSETGDGGDGSGNKPGDGSNYMIAVGVTMQVVYFRYDECFNRYNSHGNVIDTLQNGTAIPWNDTGKDLGISETTVFDAFSISPYTFLLILAFPVIRLWKHGGERH